MISHISNLLWIHFQESNKLSNGTRISLNKDYDFCRFAKPTDPTIVKQVTAKLRNISNQSIGAELNYPVMKGQNYNDKYVLLVYPKNSNTPCAFNVAIEWEHQGSKCMHIGLVMVVPDHQGNRLQGPMVITNVFVYSLLQPNGFWITDLGRSPSGSRLFAHNFLDVCPRPINEQGENCQSHPFQQSLAKAFHANLARDAGISMNCKLEGSFVVKGSNGPGGAEALVGGIPKSRNESYNRWIERLCPDPTDEVIMVGHCSLPYFFFGKMLKPLLLLCFGGVLVLSVGVFLVWKNVGAQVISSWKPKQIIVTDDPGVWNQFKHLLQFTVFCMMAVAAKDKHSFMGQHASRAIVATILPFVAWVVIPRMEFRHQLVSRLLFGGDHTAAFYGFAAFVLSLSFWRETVVARAMAANPVMWTTGNKVLDGMTKKAGKLVSLLGAIVGLSGFYQMHVNTYYPEYFGFVPPHMVTAFPYNCLSHPMYVGAVLGHYGQALSQMSLLGMQVALVSGLGYWTAAKIFEDPFMDVFYGSL